MGDHAVAVRKISLALPLRRRTQDFWRQQRWRSFRPTGWTTRCGMPPGRERPDCEGRNQRRAGEARQFRRGGKCLSAAVGSLPPGAIQSRSALDLIQHQDFRAVVELLRNRSRFFRRSAKLRTLLGVAQYSSADTDEAVPSLIDAIAVDPSAEPRTGAGADPLAVFRGGAAGGNGAPVQSEPDGFQRVEAPPGTPDRRCRNAERSRRTGSSGRAPTIRCTLRTGARFRIDDRLRRHAGRSSPARVRPVPANHYRMGLIYRRLGMNDLSRKEMDLRNQMLEKDVQRDRAWLSALKVS